MVPLFEKYTQERSSKEPNPSVDESLQKLYIVDEDERQLFEDYQLLMVA